MVGSRVWVNAPQDRGSEGVVVGKYDSPHSFWVRVGPSLLRRNRKHLALLPERVSPGVIRDENPKRGLMPKTGVSNDFTGCTFAYPNSPQVGVQEQGPQGSPHPGENSQENPKPGNLESISEETFEESSRLQLSVPGVVTRSGRVSKPSRNPTMITITRFVSLPNRRRSLPRSRFQCFQESATGIKPQDRTLK